MMLLPLLSVGLLPFAFGALLHADGSTPDPLLPAVVSEILLHYFSHPYQPVQIYQAATVQSFEQQDTVDAVVRSLRGRCAVSFGTPDDQQLHNTPRPLSVLFLDGLEALAQTLLAFDHERNDYSGRYLLVLSGNAHVGTNGTILRAIFEELWQRHIVHVNVLLHERTVVVVYTYQPYSPVHCGAPVSQLVTSYSETSRDVRAVDLYPGARFSTFHNCILKVGTFEAKPYMMLDRKADGFVELGGFEGDLLHLLAQRLQFRVEVIEPPNRTQWGTPGPKGNSTGTMMLLQDEQVDFIIACMALDVTRNLYLKPGVTHYTSHVSFAVPQGRAYTAFEKLFRPFRRDIWAMLSVYLGGVVFVVMGLSFTPAQVREFVYGRGVRMPLMNALYLLFGGSVMPVPMRNFPRTLFALWLMFTFIIRTVYQGSLYLYLQRSANYPPLATLAEIHRSTLEYHMVTIAMRFFRDKAAIAERTHFIPPGLDSLGSMVADMADRYQDRVVVCPIDMVAYNNKLQKRSRHGKKIHVTREPIRLFPITIYYPKKSLLTQVFDREVRKITQSGLMHFWIRNYGDYDFHTSPPASAGGPKQLTNAHLAGAYQIFVVALLLSVLTFLAELLSLRVRTLQKMLEFFIH